MYPKMLEPIKTIRKVKIASSTSWTVTSRPTKDENVLNRVIPMESFNIFKYKINLCYLLFKSSVPILQIRGKITLDLPLILRKQRV